MKSSHHPTSRSRRTGPWQWLRRLWRRLTLSFRVLFGLPSPPRERPLQEIEPEPERAYEPERARARKPEPEQTDEPERACPRKPEPEPILTPPVWENGSFASPSLSRSHPPNAFLLGLDNLKGLEYLSAQELLAYINWPRATADEEEAFSLGEALSDVAWGDEDEDLAVPEMADLSMTSPESEPRPSAFLFGLDDFPHLAALSVAEFLTEIPWQKGKRPAKATPKDVSSLGDLLVEFPE